MVKLIASVIYKDEITTKTMACGCSPKDGGCIDLNCDCQKTGVCTCGPDCNCAANKK